MTNEGYISVSEEKQKLALKLKWTKLECTLCAAIGRMICILYKTSRMPWRMPIDEVAQISDDWVACKDAVGDKPL